MSRISTLILLFFLTFLSADLQALTTLIDPNGDGGFETGTTFETNGWAKYGTSANQFQIGSVPGTYAGSRCTFVSNSATAWSSNLTNTLKHLYRDVTFPANETEITLTFLYKTNLVQANPLDGFSVRMVETNVIIGGSYPVGDVILPGPICGAAVNTWYVLTVYLPTSYAGTTKRLVFSWYNDNSHPLTLGALDNIELTSQAITLPVELSSFTGVITPQNQVLLQWVTQSETNVSGYYVFRYYVDYLNNAERINAFIPATNTSQEADYVFVDNEAIAGNTYYYWLQHIDMNGEAEFHGPISVHLNVNTPVIPIIPLETGLQEIYPNPFSRMATISYGLAKAAKVELLILNSKGQIVRYLDSGNKNSGNFKIFWNGLGDNGIEVTTGVYFIRMTADKKVWSSKLVLMK